MICSECGTTKCYLQITTPKGTFHIDKKGNMYDFHFEDTEEALADVLNDVIASSGCCEKCEEYIPVVITLKDTTTFNSANKEKLALIEWD